MSFSLSKVLQFPQCIPLNEYNVNSITGLPLLGGILSDGKYVWHAQGPRLEIRNNKTGAKVGVWTFGCILKDSNTRVVFVEEIPRVYNKLSLLAVGTDCTISSGVVCIFDIGTSKVIRAIHIKEKISSLHIIDPGLEVLNLPGPLRNFDGIIGVGTEGGSVFLIDMCRQICEESLQTSLVRDELNPCQINVLTIKNITKIEYYKERSVREGDHLAIHLNAVLNSRTDHFTLKGPNDVDRIYVNREEVTASAVYYCPQLTSLLIGYNFGAFQLWDLTTLKLIYTSPVCDEHLPITHFTLQEPTDDPRAFCYIWVSYSNNTVYQSGFPFAVMYSVCYESKEYHEGYGYLYQDFQYCAVRFQMLLDNINEHRTGDRAKGGYCLSFQAISKQPTNRDISSTSNGDTLALCIITWVVQFNKGDTEVNTLVFDLNQWYKEQMPSFSKWKDCTNYILWVNLSELIVNSGRNSSSVLSVTMDVKSLRQFVGVQKLEEHFCPTSLSFNFWVLRENDTALVHCEGLQKALLYQIEAAGPLCMMRPDDIYRQIIKLGLTPQFIEPLPLSIEFQREIILNVALEQRLVGWLCKCASEWANGSFSATGCSLPLLLNWAFQRAVVLKTNCDKFCIPLFDYSHLRLDNNTSLILNSCTTQINNLCTFYSYVTSKLFNFVPSPEIITEQQATLEMVSVYFEVLMWLVNVGLLPECHPSGYPRADNAERISAPYPVQELINYYNEKRTQLALLSKESFASSDNLLFIDNLISFKCGAERLQTQWQEDGGNGLYPPPSIQSMLRTYLIPETSISHKHSLVIYVFLDLAMALDQMKYLPVITQLIKFPAVFKVSPSIIKITQAFWQLDHGDYNIAVEQLLDSQVLNDDLQPWHHAIALRALLLQNQNNLALLYMQIRKPPITNEKDILTAISLLVANGMLDEAFYFNRQHRTNNNDKLLKHLFHECNKNKSLQTMLYKCLQPDEEKTLFKYLKSINNSKSDELQIFYHLLRSRFVEAFDVHTNIRSKTQGLTGQKNQTIADQVIKIFRKFMPEVNRNLLEYVRKERTNIWKEIPKPTPLSVFVHNTDEQIQYKSSSINAALAKSKNTFSDSFKQSELTTEEIPFLRTPVAFEDIKRPPCSVIQLKIDGEFGPSSCKRLRLSPRAPTSSPFHHTQFSMHSKMLTPIVKRKTSLHRDTSTSSNITCTPQSILKVRKLMKHAENTTGDVDMVLRNEVSSPRSSNLCLLPRRSLASKRSHVQFEEATGFSSSLSDQSIKPMGDSTAVEDQILQRSSLSSKDVSLMVSSKNSSTGDEDFYSPDNSGENSVGVEKEETVEDKREVVEQLPTESPRARRTYKRSFEEDSSKNTSESTESSLRQSPRLLQKVKGRKSLSRQVLENNAFSKLSSTKELSFSRSEKTVVIEKSGDSNKITTIESDITLSDVSISETQTKKYQALLSKSTIMEVSGDSGSSVSPKLEEKAKEAHIEIYEDLSSGSEDIEDVLGKSNRETKISDEFNEFEMNVFSVPTSPSHSLSEANEINSDSYSISNLEVAFIENISPNKSSIITISSSEETSSTSEHSDNEEDSNTVFNTQEKEVVEAVQETEKSTVATEEYPKLTQDTEEKHEIVDDREEREKSTNTEDECGKLEQVVEKETEALVNEKINQSANTMPKASTVTADQSTNTTVYPGKTKTDQSTNTTVVGSKPSNDGQSTSSSDTTEDVGEKQEIIVMAQVHTPSEDAVVVPGRRVTRKNSTLIVPKVETIQIDLVESEKTMNLLNVDIPQGTSYTGKIKGRRSSHTGVIQTDNIDCHLDSSKHLIETPKPLRRTRKTRSASVDEVKTYIRKRSLRSNSSEERFDDSLEKSKSQLPVISEEAINRKPTEKKVGSVIETYTSSRRLTRKQASMLQKVSTPNEVETIDPIILLDKEQFEGKPDPDEVKVYNTSPSNSSLGSFTKPARRSNRSASAVSVASDSSDSRASPVSSPKKESKQATLPTESIRTRLRKYSQTSWVGSEKSELDSPAKRTRNKSEESEVIRNTRTTRNRASSVSSGASSSSKTRSARRQVSVTSDLPKINEEKVESRESSTQRKSRRQKNV